MAIDFSATLNQTNTTRNLINNDLNKINTLKAKFDHKKQNNDFKTMLADISNKKTTQDIKEKKLNKVEKKLYKSCVEMESLLWKQVLNSMKKTINKYKLLDGGQGEEIFSDFLYDEYSKMMAKNSNTNIADTLYKQLSAYL